MLYNVCMCITPDRKDYRSNLTEPQQNKALYSVINVLFLVKVGFFSVYTHNLHLNNAALPVLSFMLKSVSLALNLPSSPGALDV